MITQQQLDQMTGRIVDNKHIFNTVFHLENEDATLSMSSAAGMKTDDYYYIASVTKLYITAVVLILKNEKKLDLNAKITDFFPRGFLDGILIYKGTDYTNRITIRHLISNTSGIPDYFFGKDENSRSGADDLLKGRDAYWTLDKTLDFVRRMKPKFRPGQKRKAEYSDTNYQLLGKILETITGKDIGEIFQDYLIKPLGLENTYVFADPHDRKPAAMYYQNKVLDIPLYMTSISAEGGLVATAKDCMTFLKAFFNGFFFAPAQIAALQEWNFMLRPATMYYGVGLEKLWTPWFISPGKSVKNILGFWGQTGSFAFYHQDSGLYFTGTANQINGRGHNAALKMMLQIIKQSPDVKQSSGI